MSINKHKLVARFGLMHMVGTNLCVWLKVVIQETKHELVHLLSVYELGGGGHHDRHRRGAANHTGETAASGTPDEISSRPAPPAVPRRLVPVLRLQFRDAWCPCVVFGDASAEDRFQAPVPCIHSDRAERTTALITIDTNCR